LIKVPEAGSNGQATEAIVGLVARNPAPGMNVDPKHNGFVLVLTDQLPPSATLSEEASIAEA
jgi:hypothetical protein